MLGKPNSEALEILRKALAGATGEDAMLQLVVARRAGINRKASLSMSSFSASMAALGEEPEEVRAEGGREEGRRGRERERLYLE